MEITESEALRNALNEMLKIVDAIFAASADAVTEPMKLRQFSMDGVRLRNECVTEKGIRLVWRIFFSDESHLFVPRPFVSLQKRNLSFLAIAREPDGRWIVTSKTEHLYFFVDNTSSASDELRSFCEGVHTGSVVSEAEAITAASIFARYFVSCLQQEI